MHLNPTPFEAGWIGLPLKGFRPLPEESATYGLFAYDKLPPLPQPPDDFEWVNQLPINNDLVPRDTELGRRTWVAWDRDRETWRSEIPARIASIRQQADVCCVSIPPTFLSFMQNHEWIHRIRLRSPTGCYFLPPEKLIPFDIRGHQAQLLRFLTDSQNCWDCYLYLPARGESCVINSWEWLEGELGKKRRPVSRIVKNSRFCATSFETFLYRYSIENELWHALAAGAKLSKEQRAYLSHYAAM